MNEDNEFEQLYSNISNKYGNELKEAFDITSEDRKQRNNTISKLLITMVVSGIIFVFAVIAIGLMPALIGYIGINALVWIFFIIKDGKQSKNIEYNDYNSSYLEYVIKPILQTSCKEFSINNKEELYYKIYNEAEFDKKYLKLKSKEVVNGKLNNGYQFLITDIITIKDSGNSGNSIGKALNKIDNPDYTFKGAFIKIPLPFNINTNIYIFREQREPNCFKSNVLNYIYKKHKIDEEAEPKDCNIYYTNEEKTKSILTEEFAEWIREFIYKNMCDISIKEDILYIRSDIELDIKKYQITDKNSIRNQYINIKKWFNNIEDLITQIEKFR